MIIDYSTLQLIVLSFFTGLGMTAGAELCKALITHTKKKINHNSSQRDFAIAQKEKSCNA